LHREAEPGIARRRAGCPRGAERGGSGTGHDVSVRAARIFRDGRRGLATERARVQPYGYATRHLGEADGRREGDRWPAGAERAREGFRWRRGRGGGPVARGNTRGGAAGTERPARGEAPPL